MLLKIRWLSYGTWISPLLKVKNKSWDLDCGAPCSQNNGVDLPYFLHSVSLWTFLKPKHWKALNHTSSPLNCQLIKWSFDSLCTEPNRQYCQVQYKIHWCYSLKHVLIHLPEYFSICEFSSKKMFFQPICMICIQAVWMCPSFCSHIIKCRPLAHNSPLHLFL